MSSLRSAFLGCISFGMVLMTAAPKVHAQESSTPPTPEPAAPVADTPPAESPPADADHSGMSFGVLGGVGFPRPLSVEAVMGFGRIGMVGLEYGVMPKITISSVDTKLWAAAANVRVFPFRGAFFLGLRGGYQAVTAATTLSASGVGSYTESAEMGTWFLNPRMGFMWTPRPFAISIDVGVQIPLSTTVTRSSLLALVSPETDARITSATDTLGRTPLPTIDLLRLGMIF